MPIRKYLWTICICNIISYEKYIADHNVQNDTKNRNTHEIELNFLNLASRIENEEKSVADLLCVFERLYTVRWSIYKMAGDAKYGPITHILLSHTHTLKVSHPVTRKIVIIIFRWIFILLEYYAHITMLYILFIINNFISFTTYNQTAQGICKVSIGLKVII